MNTHLRKCVCEFGPTKINEKANEKYWIIYFDVVVVVAADCCCCFSVICADKHENRTPVVEGQPIVTVRVRRIRHWARCNWKFACEHERIVAHTWDWVRLSVSDACGACAIVSCIFSFVLLRTHFWCQKRRYRGKMYPPTIGRRSKQPKQCVPGRVKECTWVSPYSIGRKVISAWKCAWSIH